MAWNYTGINAAAPQQPVGNGQTIQSNQGRYFFQEPKDTVDIRHHKKASGDGKFSFKDALKNFGKGLLSPITSLIKHPLQAAAMIGGGIALAAVAPWTIPLMVLGFGGYSLYQTGKGVSKAVSSYQKGDYDGAEEAFQEIGTGAVGTALSVAGVRGGAAISAEARAAAAASKGGASAADAITAGAEAASRAKGMSLTTAIRENAKMLTSRDGYSAMLRGLKPASIRQSVANFTGGIRSKLDNQRAGIKSRSLSEAKMQSQIEKMATEIFDDMGLPPELRPKVKLDIYGDMPPTCAAAYEAESHTLYVKPHVIKKNLVDLRRMIAHEGEHARHGALRSQLPLRDIRSAVNEEIVSGVRNGEPDLILRSYNEFAEPDLSIKKPFKSISELRNALPKYVEPPKWTAGMRPKVATMLEEDVLPFSGSMNEGLVQRNAAGSIEKMIANGKAADYMIEDISSLEGKVSQLLDESPDFLAHYNGDKTAAMNHLMEYFEAQTFRADMWPGKMSTYRIKENPALSAEERAEAMASVRTSIPTIEGNMRNNVLLRFKKMSDRFAYIFSPEEIAARNAAARVQLKVVDQETAALDIKTPAGLAKLRELARKRAGLNAELTANDMGAEYMDIQRRLRMAPGDEALQAHSHELLKSMTEQVPQTGAREYLSPDLYPSRLQLYKLQATATGLEAPIVFNQLNPAFIAGASQNYPSIRLPQLPVPAQYGHS